MAEMDSQVEAEGRLLDIVDYAWRADVLPDDDIAVPASELVDPEADDGDERTTIKEAESRWTDQALTDAIFSNNT
ncbi:hypothetical protein GE061_014522 [Apolygus lucorum]|uniref:Anaphase-promoting complex subunit 13 n=1 Tax=Apolygus lucorum TaxID=248454 RepID=A0A8S9XIF2_APOLU|nr:hypothetical protein GE061_014522 [Apolygus lucorum]